MFMEIKVQFPADCYVQPRVARDEDGNPIVNPETGEQVKKRGYYRGIVIEGKEAFREHYVDRNGNPVRQPKESKDLIYYSLNAPELVGRDASGKPVYAIMTLQAWSNTDNNGVTKRGIKVVDGRNQNELDLAELKKVREMLGDEEAVTGEYNQRVAQVARNAFDNALRNVRNRSTATTEAPAQTLEPQPFSEPDPNEPSF
jgi:hypothetical protein